MCKKNEPRSRVRICKSCDWKYELEPGFADAMCENMHLHLFQEFCSTIPITSGPSDFFFKLKNPPPFVWPLHSIIQTQFRIFLTQDLAGKHATNIDASNLLDNFHLNTETG